MRLVVFSHKPCWASPRSATGVATDGGFAFQMRALSELFDRTTVLVPVTGDQRRGEALLDGARLEVVQLKAPSGSGLRRKVLLPFWFLRSLPTLVRAVRSADAVHAPIPGDVGTIGMLLAVLFRRPLFVRHCGNWEHPKSTAEHGWRWFMERFAGGRNVMLATGGGDRPPSLRNDHVRWIFSTSLTAAQLSALGRERPAPAPTGPRLVTVGRQVPEKGTATVVEAAALLVAEMPDIHLDVVGEGPDLDAFVQLARDRCVDGACTFHGALGHAGVLDILAGADLFVFPTRSSEGFPKVVVEAMAAGLPIITSAVSVLPTLTGSGAGVSLEDPTPDAVADAVRQLTLDRARYGEMSAAALEQASRLSLEAWADEIRVQLERAWAVPLREREVSPAPQVSSA